jgi:3alpha(or 20beta)-hydroxysteroid dehydrogenase
MEEPAHVARSARVVGEANETVAAITSALGAAGLMVLSEPSAQLDVLVFVAPESPTMTFAGTSPAEFAGSLGGVLRGAFLALQSGVAAMRAGSGRGSVVLVAPPALHRAFDAPRQGLRLLAKAAALELGPEGIRVNIVLPGAGETPLGGDCAPANIAAAVAFIASDQSRFMTGADLVVDGGAMIS